MKTLVLLASLGLIVAGCASEEPSQRETAAETPPASTPIPAEAAVQTPTPATEIHLAGALGCAHCTFDVATDDCIPAIQTEDGVVHLLEDVDPTSDLFTSSHDEKQIQVVGTPREEDGTHYLTVASWEM